MQKVLTNPFPCVILYTEIKKEATTMKAFTIDHIDHKNAGIAREWALCHHYGIERTSHDHVAYDKGSDIEIDDMHISVKSSAFTLMSGRLCEGRDTMEGIWNLYAEHTHSNAFAYVSVAFKAYIMNIDEFKLFVFTFCALERESSKNGGALKIKCRKESGKMLRWLEEHAA